MDAPRSEVEAKDSYPGSGLSKVEEISVYREAQEKAQQSSVWEESKDHQEKRKGSVFEHKEQAHQKKSDLRSSIP